jgi:glucose-1-phosphate thymidylyltransferase
MKAILVAGGHGSRLYPFTRYTHKALLPLHRRPVIDYALATIRRAGIKDITIIGNRFIGQIAQHIGTGLPGENIHYVIEEEPRGVHHALNLARPHVEGSRVLVYFSDNITTMELAADVKAFRAADSAPGCVLIGREVPNPEQFGVAVFDGDGKFIDILEKPAEPPSSFAVGGIYLFDETFWSKIDQVAGNDDSITITDINRLYLAEGKARLIDIGEEIWLDCGTPDSLQLASNLARDGRLSPEPCNLRDGDPPPTA